jgi:hypothetical protein
MHTILFTGHRPDSPDRAGARFPDRRVPAAYAAIRAALLEIAASSGPCRGIAGGASGGDILFHEACLEVGIPSRLYLAVPPAPFVASSVAPSGPPWVERFNALLTRLPPPVVLEPQPPASIVHSSALWERNNVWLLDEALREGTGTATLVALWDGEPGDGPGGTNGLVALARGRGVRTRVIDTWRLDDGGAGDRREARPETL